MHVVRAFIVMMVGCSEVAREIRSVMFHRSSVRFVLSAVVGFAVCAQANLALAHFLFIRIGEHAEAGRGVEVFFSERAEAGDPRYVDKVAGTKLWMQEQPGQFTALKTRLGPDRLRAFLPAEGAVSVTGECEYGTLQREVTFLLRYYPKGIAGKAELVNQFKPHDQVPVEIMATVNDGSITLVLLDHGKPVPNAVFTTCDDNLVNVELKADGEGKVTWAPPSSGHYCIYTKVVRNEGGELKGKKYTEIREFPTIAFQWPLTKEGGDQEAVDLFQKAVSSRAVWKDFPGFQADVAGNYDGRPFSGTAEVGKSGAVTLKIDQDVAVDWVQDQLRSLTNHRLDSSRSETPVLRFADRDVHNPLGRLVTFVGGQMASSYRVKDDQLMTVNRRFGDTNMTITVLENQPTAEGKYLPHLYNVQYWNGVTGELLRTESFENRWQRVGSFDLPTLNKTITSSASGLTVRSLRLSKHQLLTEGK